ncbi:DNA replication complex GINS family protein [Candidatus Bathyarchaeota archaeon]|nr:DNA replication complex GINS family protein [Candidatus Bathyarchaeota archaeon]
MLMKIENLDFCFENLVVRVTADRNYPKIKLVGLSAGPFEEGNEYEIYYWIAKELAEAGIVHFREDDLLNATALYKIQWKERVQIAGQISALSEDFYPKLRRYLTDIKAEIAKHPEKAQEYEKAKHLAWDIVNSRLKKIITLSSGPAQTGQLQKKLTCEERFIYEQLGKMISEWKAQILDFKGER